MKRVRNSTSEDSRNYDYSQYWRSGVERGSDVNKRYHAAAYSDGAHRMYLSTRAARPMNFNKPLPNLPPLQEKGSVEQLKPPLPCIKPILKSKQTKRNRQRNGRRVRFPWHKRSRNVEVLIPEWQTEKPAQYTAVEKGIQTDPVIVVEKYPNPKQGGLRAQSSIGPNVRPRMLRHPSDAESDRGLSTPLWSPRLDSSVRNAQDYFVLSGGSDTEALSLRHSDRFPSTPQIGKGRKAGSQERYNRLSSGNSGENSADTLGTYESRYSSRGHDDSTVPSPGVLLPHKIAEGLQSREDRLGKQDMTLSRPPILRSSSSRDTVHVRPKLSRLRFISHESLETNSLEAESSAHDGRGIASDSNVRRTRHGHKKTSLNHVAVQNRRQQSKSHSSERTYEQRSGQGSSDESADLCIPEGDMNFYQVRLDTNPEDMGRFAWEDVPDHFPGSPLCPQHPKHKSRGLGICPMHGSKKTVEPMTAEALSARRGNVPTEGDVPVTGIGTIGGTGLVVSSNERKTITPSSMTSESGKYNVYPVHGHSKDRVTDKLTRLL